MSSAIGIECSICEDPLEGDDRTVITDCQHTFHHACAQKRLDAKQKSDCHVCHKESALSDALKRATEIPKPECSICEDPLDTENELITTKCQHTFHRSCAQTRLDKKNKSDCHVCHKESALRDALEQVKAIPIGDCSICEDSLHTEHDLVTTECQHTFHRSCAQNRLNKKQKSDCHVCHKESALAKALRRTSIHHNYPAELKKNVKQSDYGASSMLLTETNEMEIGENKWECAKCSIDNESLTNRCKSCGTPRYMHLAKPYIAAQEVDPNPMQYSYNSPTSKISATTTNNSSPPRQVEAVVYITDLPLPSNDHELGIIIRRRIEAILQTKLTNIQCYSKLGFGIIRVENDPLKNRLIEVRKIALDHQKDLPMISFSETHELVAYIVLDTANEKNVGDLPRPDEVIARWTEVFKGEKPYSCDQANIQFPNIYRITFISPDGSFASELDQDFAVKNRCARVYMCADCNYLEDLPKSITEDQLRKAISSAIGLQNIPSSALHIELNKQANNACIIADNMVRKWSTKNLLYLGDKIISIKEKLTCRLLLSPVPENYNINNIVNHARFDNKAKIIKHRDDKLILEILDKKIFDDCMNVGALRIGDKETLFMNNYTISSDPEEHEIDTNTWYEDEMLRCKPDIMQFVRNFDHNIFHFKWNSQIWLEQFNRWSSHRQTGGRKNNTQDGKGLTPDQMRHRLRVTVMLNTIAQIRKTSYTIGDNKIDLNLDKTLPTIIYNHQSKLKSGGPLQLKEAKYKQTEVKVINDDCLIVYEKLIREGKKPLLLNMASATSPGGGYRKGDGAQEENLFRRSDYCRSLDVGLDEYQHEPCERFHCTSNGEHDSHLNVQKMYPMDEFGAIYTSDLTVFRQPESTGYEYMNQPLHGVCSLAMAAYREPKLEGNMLAPRYAVGMRKKIENIFSIAYHHHHDCLVLSALGCGAFKNPPDHVAKLFRSVIEQYAGFFQSIVFAIIDDHNTGQSSNPQGNFLPFQRELDGLTVQPVIIVKQPNIMIGPYRFLSDGLTVSDICIYDLPPCHFGAVCQDIYQPKHAQQFSHPPLCIQALQGTCTQQDDLVHKSSWIHRTPCKYGVQCRDTDDEKHAQEFEHPSYCPQGGDCQDTSDNHEKSYRHLPLCDYSHKCTEYRKHVTEHCKKFRHCMPRCPHGNICANFHDKKHIDEYQHPFPSPCPLTPYNCALHDELTQTTNTRKLSDKVQQHCLDFAHVCRFGRNCHDTNITHKEKSIHVPRLICPYDRHCDKLVQEDHLNSYTHSNIRDIRLLCKHADKCRDRHDPKHTSKFRHTMLFDDSGVVRYFNLNQNIDFVQNQNDNITRVNRYIEQEKWKPLSLGSISDEILDWIRTVQPIHRCSPEIFDSILLHGHVMGREYMEHLKKPKFVANCVLEHSRIRRIKRLELQTYAEHAQEYVTALVGMEYKKKKFPDHSSNTEGILIENDDLTHLSSIVQKEEIFLTPNISNTELKAIRTKAIEIAEASMSLFQKPYGIGYLPDKDLGTNKHIFSILGPHLGHYYGNVVIVFKREILHHPDANFTIQSATSYVSGKGYLWRPWLGDVPSSITEQIQLFNKTKLHASVPGYEYATALELIALTSLYLHKKSMNVDLKMILKRWCEVDSHKTIEAHLPQLIPLDYIDHIYITQKLFDKLNANSHRAIEEVFKDRITITRHASDDDYNKFVVEELIKKFGQRNLHSVSRPIRGAVLTIEATNLSDHFLLPLTISQAYAQYVIDHPTATKNNTIYIYWQVMNGDMMLTLSNHQDPNELQSNLKRLICYIAPKPISTNSPYMEHTSYLCSGHPSQHASFINDGDYGARSTALYVGCNTDDFMTFCLEIQRSNGMVSLYHAGPNSIYNHEKISCTFSRSDLDLNKLEFIHVSAGTRTVPIRNLIICFERQTDLHPTYDTKFKRQTSSATMISSYDTQTTKENDNVDDNSTNSSGRFAGFKNAVAGVAVQVKEFFIGTNDSSQKPCPDGIYCLKQSERGSDHNSKYSHPCRFAELCRNPEPHLTHEPRQVPECKFDKNCKILDDPIHRSQYRHTGLPYFLIPCRDQGKCQNKSKDHRMKYSHGERIAETKQTMQSQGQQESFESLQQQIPCKWGLQCRDISGTEHCKKYSHPTVTQQHNDHRKPCKWGIKCHDYDSHHKTAYFHPSTWK